MKITLIGASGHGKVIADIALKNGYDEIEFLDDEKFPHEKKFCGFPVSGGTDKAIMIENDLFIAIGSSKARKLFMERYSDKHIVSLIHPDAVIAGGVKFGYGSAVMAGAVINSGAVIGNGCIINTCSSVDHDCVIGDYSHIAVGSHLAGNVTVGAGTWIGAGVTVSNRINICSDCMIGAGAVVVRDIKESGTYVGVPAHMI